MSNAPTNRLKANNVPCPGVALLKQFHLVPLTFWLKIAIGHSLRSFLHTVVFYISITSLTNKKPAKLSSSDHCINLSYRKVYRTAPSSQSTGISNYRVLVFFWFCQTFLTLQKSPGLIDRNEAAPHSPIYPCQRAALYPKMFSHHFSQPQSWVWLPLIKALIADDYRQPGCTDRLNTSVPISGSRIASGNRRQTARKRP